MGRETPVHKRRAARGSAGTRYRPSLVRLGWVVWKVLTRIRGCLGLATKPRRFYMVATPVPAAEAIDVIQGKSAQSLIM